MGMMSQGMMGGGNMMTQGQNDGQNMMEDNFQTECKRYIKMINEYKEKGELDMYMTNDLEKGRLWKRIYEAFTNMEIDYLPSFPNPDPKDPSNTDTYNFFFNQSEHEENTIV